MKTTTKTLTMLLALVVAALAAQPEPFKVTTTLSATEVPEGGTLDLVIRFDLADGVHLYKDKIEFTWDELKGAVREAVEKPKGQLVPDPASLEPGARLEAYEGSAEVRVGLKATG